MTDAASLEFVALPYSPWSEKARWALDHAGVGYRETAYLPIVGIPRLRLRLRRWRGKITVPILFEGQHALADSFDIARRADELGSAATLFPDERLEDIADWNQRSEAVLESARALATFRVAADPEALEATVPPALPKVLRGAFGRHGVNYLRRKYDLEDQSEDEHRERIRSHLRFLREQLGGRDTLYDAFSYADITMACSLQLIKPVDGTYIRLNPSVRRGMTDKALAEEFAELVTWRDALYTRRRIP